MRQTCFKCVRVLEYSHTCGCHLNHSANVFYSISVLRHTQALPACCEKSEENFNERHVNGSTLKGQRDIHLIRSECPLVSAGSTRSDIFHIPGYMGSTYMSS